MSELLRYNSAGINSVREALHECRSDRPSTNLQQDQAPSGAM